MTPTDPESLALRIIEEYTGLASGEIDRKSVLLGDLNLDSLDLVQMVIDLETELGCDDIPDEDYEKVLTVEDFIELAKKYGKKRDA